MIKRLVFWLFSKLPFSVDRIAVPLRTAPNAFLWFIQSGKPGNSETYLQLSNGTAETPAPPKSLKQGEVDPFPWGRVLVNWSTFLLSTRNFRAIPREYAIISHDRCLIGDLSSTPPWANNHPITQMPFLPRKRHLGGFSLYLCSHFGNKNYFAWMTQTITRLGLIERAGIRVDCFDNILVEPFELPFQEETLRALKVCKSQTRFSDEYSHVEFDRCIFPSWPSRPGFIDSESISWLKERLLPPHTKVKCRKVYFARLQCKRSLTNENEIHTILEETGFEIVDMGKLTVSQQAQIANEASVVIAPHGAAMTNLVFCKPGTTVLEIISPHHFTQAFWWISHINKLDYHFTYSVPENPKNPSSKVTVDVDSIKNFIKRHEQ